MSEEQWVNLIASMQLSLEAINSLKSHPEWADPLRLSVAATHLETAMLWVANARTS